MPKVSFAPNTATAPSSAATTPAAMSPELAQQLLAAGAVLIVSGCPVGTEFGIDLNAYRIDERFRGVKMIPPGVHYVYTASQGTYGDTALRTGFMHFFQPGEVMIRQWDEAAEELHERRASSAEAAAAERDRIRGNLKELDRFLAPYDYNDLSDWQFLTQHITAGRIERTLPACGLVRTAAEYESCPDSERPRGSHTDPAAANGTVTAAVRRLHNRMLQQDDSLLPDLPVVAGTAMRFTPLPPRCPPNAAPADVTAAFMDCLPAVERLVGAFAGASLGIVDEAQIAFVCFVAGCSVDALAHWRRMLHVLAHSERAVRRWPALYAAYVRCLDQQLERLPEEMQPAGEFNTVYRDVQQLVRNCWSSETAGGISDGANGGELVELCAAVELLVARVRSALGWDLGGPETGDEDPEDAPVVVEME